jgi:hypothetical protein
VNHSALIQLLPEAVLVVTALVMLGVPPWPGKKSGGPIFPGTGIGIATGASPAPGSPCCCQWRRGDQHAADGERPAGADLQGRWCWVGLLAVWLPPARREIAATWASITALMLFALTGLLLAVGSNHLLFLFVALELSSLSLYLLAGFPRTRRAAEASLKYFLFGGVSAAFMLVRHQPALRISHAAATLAGIAELLGRGPCRRWRDRSGDVAGGPGLQACGGAVPLLGTGCLSGRARHHGGRGFRRLQSRRLVVLVRILQSASPTPPVPPRGAK